MTNCHVCQARCNDANLCGRHTRVLEQAIAELPALLHELDVTISRQDVGTGAPLISGHHRLIQIPGVHYDEGTTALPSTPWAFGWDAADVRWRIENTVVTWSRHILEARGLDPLPPLLTGPVCAVDLEHTIHDSCTAITASTHLHHVAVNPGRLLLDSLESIRLDEAAGVIYDELTSCQRDALRAIDRQAPDVFAGRCDAPDVRADVDDDGTIRPTVSTCGADLYAHLGDTEVRCPRCGHVYDLVARKRKMASKVDDEWARPHLISDALSTLDHPINASTLRTWINRDAKLARTGHLPDYPLVLQVGIDDDGHPLYRVGDVRARIGWSRERMSA